MSNMSGVLPYEFDSELSLRAAGLAALTTDTDLAVQKLVQVGAYWQGHRDIRNGAFNIVIKVETFAADANPTLQFILKTCSSLAKANPQTQVTLTALAAGTYVLPVSEAALIADDADATHWYLTVDVGGTNPTMAMAVYIAPDTNL